MGVFQGGRVSRGPPIKEIFAPFKYSLSLLFAKPRVQFV